MNNYVLSEVMSSWQQRYAVNKHGSTKKQKIKTRFCIQMIHLARATRY